MIAALCTFLVLLAVPTLELDSQGSTPESPCPDVFMYEPPGSEPGRWDGVLKLSTDIAIHSLSLDIVLDNKADILGNWIGEVSTIDNKDFKIENTDMQLNPGPAVEVHFFVQYNTLNATPRLVAIRLNGREICNANTPQPVNLNTKPNPDRFAPPRDVLTSPASNPYTPDGKVQCGTVALNPIPLVVKGSSTMEGQWPWQIALYVTNLVNNEYYCGGTLVSHKHVITAAHCVTRSRSRWPVDMNTLTVYLGKHSLKTSVIGVQIRFVEKITVHPDFNGTSFSRDVAILELWEPVHYSNWVRPACLWPDDQVDLTNVIGKKGSVVGWGFDHTGAASEELKRADMPVVSEVVCIRSKPLFFGQFTTEYTYCAGNRDGISVCNGDSGSGMVFRMNGIWYLRGLVSLSARKEDDSKCDPTHFIIFTDLAKFLPWIHENVFDF